MQLTRKRVIVTAIDLLEAEGAGAVSMTRLATELGCGMIALYNLFDCRNELLDAIANEIISAVPISPEPAASWQDQLRSQARALRQAGAARPRCMLLALSRPRACAAMARQAETGLTALRAGGLTGPAAARVLRALGALISGSLLADVGVVPGLSDDDAENGWPRLTPAQFPQLAALAADMRGRDPEADFEFALDLLVLAAAALCPSPALPALARDPLCDVVADLRGRTG